MIRQPRDVLCYIQHKLKKIFSSYYIFTEIIKNNDFKRLDNDKNKFILYFFKYFL